MRVFYEIGLRLLFALAYLRSFWDRKTRQWLTAHKTFSYPKLENISQPIWFHCASLGEFESIYPLIKKIKTHKIDAEFVVSFFSPSGYFHIFKKYPELKPFIFPLDTSANMRRLISNMNPRLIVIAESDIWINLLRTTYFFRIPIISVNSSFYAEQIWFKPYAKYFLYQLKKFDQIFTRDKSSLKKLAYHEITNACFAGDLRLDQVLIRKSLSPQLPFIAQFKENHNIFIAASIYENEIPYILRAYDKLKKAKLIIVPHEPDIFNMPENIGLASNKIVKFSEFEEKYRNQNILLVDQFGLLFDIYKYGDIAYVGGGFGKGIHNTLEALVFGLPVLIGPNYKKFRMIQRFVELGVIHKIMKLEALQDGIKNLHNKAKSKNFDVLCNKENKDMIGGSEIIMDYLLENKII